MEPKISVVIPAYNVEKMSMDEWYYKAVLPHKKGVVTGKEKFLIVDKFLLSFFSRSDKIIIADLGGVTLTYKHFNELFPNSFVYSINLVKEQIKGVPNPLVEDVLRTSLKSNSVDMAFAGDVIEHIIDTDKFVMEVYRLLKKRGVFILTTPNLCDWLNRIFVPLGLSPHNYNPSAYRFGNPFFHGNGVWHKSVFTLSGLKEFLESYGFRILNSKGYTYVDEVTGLKRFRKLINYFLPTSWKEGICVLAQKI